jgi:hypothetical protein
MPRRLKSEGIDALVGADIQAILARYQGLEVAKSAHRWSAARRRTARRRDCVVVRLGWGNVRIFHCKVNRPNSRSFEAEFEILPNGASENGFKL